MLSFLTGAIDTFFDCVTNFISNFTKLSNNFSCDSEGISAQAVPAPSLLNDSKSVLTDTQKKLFEHWLRCPASPQWLINRCRIISALDKGKLKKKIAKKLNIVVQTVRKWAKRWHRTNKKLAKLEATEIKSKEYVEKILMTLRDASRSGRPIIFTAEQVVQIVAMACEVKDNSDSHVSHQTCGDLAAEAVKRGIVDSISVSSVGRFLSEAHIKPHKNSYWLNAKFEDPEQFLAEAKTVCDLYHSA